MDRVVERTPWQKYRKPVTWVGTAILALLAFWFFKPDSGRTLRIQNDRIVISRVSGGVFDDYIPVRGQVAPLKTVFLDAIEGGRVEALFVEDGAMINAGDLIVELSNTQLQLDVIARESEVTEQLNNLRNTELSLEQNRLEHKRNLVDINYHIIRLAREIERLSPLVEKDMVDNGTLERLEDENSWYLAKREITLESQATDERLQKAQMEQLRIAGTQLEKNLGVARRNLDALSMRAPVSGKLTAFDLEIGQALPRGVNIGQIDDPESFKVKADIDEFYLSRVDLEQTAVLKTGGSEYALSVRKIYPQVTNGSFEVDLIFTGKEPTSIRRGQTLQLNLQLGSPSESLLIPNGAFYQDTGGNWVFVVAPDGSRAVKRNVRMGRRNLRFIEVLDGLEPGEQVITSPYTNYLDMDRLELQASE
ncbi:MAG: efflux RND transporter periplasmic adaptor subunit [Gammaproteobacteria bacterium]|nr:efflux RND transporter periplasmic adaptor subunit [Gammaproteobacteria bacterium]